MKWLAPRADGRHLVFIGLLAAFLAAGPTRVAGEDFKGARPMPSMWVSSHGERPITFDKWRAAQVPVPTSYQLLSVTARAPGPPTVLVDVFVNSSLYPAIESSIGQYRSDLASAGYATNLYVGTWATPPSLRAQLQADSSAGLVGCVLIGDLPVAWYEMTEPQDWGGEYVEFPIDLFYEDLDGVWVDADSNGEYDDHTGSLQPDIWVGRLTAHTLTWGSEAYLINNYLSKNHAYRTGSLSCQDRALVYVDDDWIPWAAGWDSEVGLAYPTRTFISDADTTVDTDYEARLANDYQWIATFVHSSSSAHYWKNTAGWDGLTYNSEIMSIDPTALFYNLYACSAARFVEANYIGGWYVFADTHGLAAVGSAKTGGMWHFSDFYSPLGQGACIGEAFRQWQVLHNEDSTTSRAYFYGMTILGDPTLTLLAGSVITPLANDSPLTFSQIPKDFSFHISGSRWCAVGINPSSNHDVQIDDNSDLSTPYQVSASAGLARDFVVTNGHVWGDAVHYARVYNGSPSDCTIEAEWSIPNLPLESAYSDSMASGEVLEAYEVNLTAGSQYAVIVQPSSGTADLSLFVFSASRQSGARGSADWSRNSGGAGQGESVSLTANASGPFAIVVVNENAQSANYSITVTKSCGPPTANFIATPRTGCPPLHVCFTDQSAGAPTSWSWEFGDGGVSTGQNSCHEYQAPGIYTVALTVTNGCGSDGEVKVGYVTVGPTFSDVPCTHWASRYIEAIYRAHVTSGCSAAPLLYCPETTVTRAQMAKFLCVTAGKQTLDRATPTFADVPKTNMFYGYIERLADAASWPGGAPTGGCRTEGTTKYFCPNNSVAREQMAKFLCLAASKSAMPSCSGTFADAPSSNTFCRFIERLTDAPSWPGGVPVTSGCACPGGFPPGAKCYCPKSPVTRGQMAVFLVRAFGIAL